VIWVFLKLITGKMDDDKALRYVYIYQLASLYVVECDVILCVCVCVCVRVRAQVCLCTGLLQAALGDPPVDGVLSRGGGHVHHQPGGPRLHACSALTLTLTLISKKKTHTSHYHCKLN